MSVDRVEAGSGQKPAAPRWMKWLLICSLAFNVLILGAIAGRIWHVRHSGFMSGPGGEAAGPNIALFTARLPSERRQAVIAAVRDERQALRPLRLEVREARLAVRAALAADPFEATRVAEAQARLLDAEVRVRKAAQQLIIKIGAVLTAEERRAFAAHIMADGPRGGRRGPFGFNRPQDGPLSSDPVGTPKEGAPPK